MENKITKKLLNALLISALYWPNAVFSHAGKATAVMHELARYHESLLKNAGAGLDTGSLIRLLKAGGDSPSSTALFVAAIPSAEKLGKAPNAADRLSAYGVLVEKLAKVHGFHDKSDTYLFFCPMVKKFWIGYGKDVRNPYDPKMRECGERRA